MASGAEMLLISALKAFVPKETAEQINAALQGMLNDGTLNGLGTLVADIQAIKRNQESIMLALGKLYADTVPRSGSKFRPVAPLLAEHGTDGSGSASAASGGTDDGNGESTAPAGEIGG